MKVRQLHDWSVSVQRAIELQHNLANEILRKGERVITPHYIAGLDVSVNRSGDGWAAAVVLDYPALRVVETRTAEGKVEFPYVPGLLSFREIPLTLKACEQLKITPDILLVDGQGIAHPRRIGLASHLGLLLDIPTIGCAKSLLIGVYDSFADAAGSFSEIKDKNGELIGAALRTRSRVKPVYISIGHKIDLSSSMHWVLECCRGFRLPEPTRLAHLASRKYSGNGGEILSSEDIGDN